MIRTFAAVMICVTLGCDSIPWRSALNEKITPDAMPVASVSMSEWKDVSKTGDVFVGISISGGGSRAANFSAAVLGEMEELGLLDHVSAISSVSGGSLTAAYYVLNRDRPMWQTEIRKRLQTNFWGWFSLKALLPWNMALNVLTDYDRSDLMAEVFDRFLFHDATFKDLDCQRLELGSCGPKLFITATDLLGRAKDRSYHEPMVYGRIPGNSLKPFVFSVEQFKEIGSRLDTYPISGAVMASGAFPLVFNNVTLYDFKRHISFGPEDILDFGSLANKLIHADDPISKDMRTSHEWLKPLEHYHPGSMVSGQLQWGILESLNRCVRYPEVCKKLLDNMPDVADGIDFRDETKRLLKELREVRPEQSSDSSYLWRLILEDLYPKELRRKSSRYVHLFDGGPTDNLGLEVMGRAARQFAGTREGPGSPACFIISIDAYSVGKDTGAEYRSDTRVGSDFFLDHNAVEAIDVMLGLNRDRVLNDQDRGGREVWTKHYPRQNDDDENAKPIDCRIWHITFDRILNTTSRVNEGPNAGAYKWLLYSFVSSIETDYALTGPKGCSADVIQEMLYRAAHQLIKGDQYSLRDTVEWFNLHGLKTNVPEDVLDINSGKTLLRESFYTEPLHILLDGKQVRCSNR